MNMDELARISWKDLEEGREARFSFTIDDADMEAFAALSGDRNPLHTDDDYARKRGYGRRLVYGGLICAQVSRLMGMHLPGRNGISSGVRLDYRNPLYPGEEATMIGRIGHLSAATRTATVKLRVEAGDRLIAKGEGLSVIMEDD